MTISGFLLALIAIFAAAKICGEIAERLAAGIVNINESSAYWQPHTPFGGYSGKTSGVGRLGGRYTLLEMSQIKTLVVDIGAAR